MIQRSVAGTLIGHTLKHIFRLTLPLDAERSPVRFNDEVTGNFHLLNPLTPNDTYSGRTAPLTYKRILYIYSTNIGTAYFKHDIYSPFFFLFKMQFVS